MPHKASAIWARAFMLGSLRFSKTIILGDNGFVESY